MKHFFLSTIILFSLNASGQKDSAQLPESRCSIAFTIGAEVPFGGFGGNTTTSSNISNAGYATVGYAVDIPFWVALKKNKNIAIGGIVRYNNNPYDITAYYNNLIASPPYNVYTNQLQKVLQSSLNHPSYYLFTGLVGPQFKKSYRDFDITFRLAVGAMVCRTPSTVLSFTFIANQYNPNGPNPGYITDTITSTQSTNSVTAYSFAADLGLGANWHFSPKCFLTINADHINAQFVFKTSTNEVGSYLNNPGSATPQTTENRNSMSVSLWNIVLGIGLEL